MPNYWKIMARDTRNECSRHCIFLSYISLPSQWFACRMSLSESSVQGKYLQISRLGVADPADLGRLAQLCSFQIQTLYACAAPMTLHCTALDTLLPGSSSVDSTMPHRDKKHSPSRVYLPWAQKPVAKWGIEMEKRETNSHSAGVHTQPSSAFRSRSWPSCTSIPGHRSANLLHNLHWIMQSFSAH